MTDKDNTPDAVLPDEFLEETIRFVDDLQPGPDGVVGIKVWVTENATNPLLFAVLTPGNRANAEGGLIFGSIARSELTPELKEQWLQLMVMVGKRLACALLGDAMGLEELGTTIVHGDGSMVVDASDNVH